MKTVVKKAASKKKKRGQKETKGGNQRTRGKKGGWPGTVLLNKKHGWGSELGRKGGPHITD